jgi:hypothetical protein
MQTEKEQRLTPYKFAVGNKVWCQDPSGDLLHNVCDSRVLRFNGYSGSMGRRGVSKRPRFSGTVVQWGVAAKASDQWYSGSMGSV